MRVDLVRDLIDRILEAAQREGSFTESVALEVERAFRRANAGATCVISEQPRYKNAQKRAAVVSDYLADKPVEHITSAHGISRATLYRYLKK